MFNNRKLLCNIFLYYVKDEDCIMKKEKGNVIALLPIGVFLVLYIGLGILFEYIMKIPMGFYNVPIVVAFPFSFFIIQTSSFS